MEDEEEFPSTHPSPADADAATADTVDDDDDQESGSPRSSSPQPNGRIAVTVASPAPPPRSSPPPPPPQQSLTLALPIQNHRSTPSSSASTAPGGGGGREDCWSEGATAVLIEAWGERYVELSRGNLKQKHWQEVAEVVSARAGGGKPAKTDVQCKNRIDTVKKKYKSEKAKIAAGGGPSKWPFFDSLDRLLGNPNPAATANFSPEAPVGTPSTSRDVGHKVPVGIPVGRSLHHLHLPPSKQNHRFVRQNNGGSRQRMKGPGPPPVDSDSEADHLSPDSSDSLPPGLGDDRRSRKRQRNELNSPRPRPPRSDRSGKTAAGAAAAAAGGEGKGRANGWGNSVRELTRAILKFGEAYEQAESAKLQQMVEMEKQRMKFAKELELQRMKFLMKTQLELSQLSHVGGRLRGVSGVGCSGGGGNHHRHQHIKHEDNGNNSDSSN